MGGCCIRGCKRNGRLHCLPNQLMRFCQWTFLMGRTDIPYAKRKNFKICGDHFLPEMNSELGTHALVLDAFPCRNLPAPGQIALIPMTELHALSRLKTCPLCDFADHFGTFSDHFEKVHQIKIEVEEFDLPSLYEFNKWKAKIEKETVASFIKLSTHKSCKSQVTYYGCHRSGVYNAKGDLENQRGTCKINGFCPARIKFRYVPGEPCTITFHKTHVGHENVIFEYPSYGELRWLAAKQRDDNLRRIKALQNDHNYEPKTSQPNGEKNDFSTTTVERKNVELSSFQSNINIPLDKQPKSDFITAIVECKDAEFSSFQQNINIPLDKQPKDDFITTNIECEDAEFSSLEQNINIPFDNDNEPVVDYVVELEQENDNDDILDKAKEEVIFKFFQIMARITDINQLEIVKKYLESMELCYIYDVFPE